jgi:competence protein ComEC
MWLAVIFNEFWNRYPALLYGLCTLTGFYIAFYPSWIILIPLTALIIPQFVAAWHRLDRSLARITLCCALLLSTIFYAGNTYTLPTLPAEGVTGTAHLVISSLQARNTHFGRQWIYQGQLIQFILETAVQDDKVMQDFELESFLTGGDHSQKVKAPPIRSDYSSKDCGNLSSSTAVSRFISTEPLDPSPIARYINISLSVPDNDQIQRPLANQEYFVQGKLKQTDNEQYILKISPQKPWHPILGSWSLTEYRYQAKQMVKRYIISHIPNPHSASFLSGLATGEFESRLFASEFSRFGLQHIMAISGFHFSIIATILGILFRFIFSRKRGAALLALLLCSYFLFLGCTPSIMRAWIAISIYLIAQLVEKKASALNSLGIALLTILLIDPLACTHMGFQFSFLTTAAILLLYSSCDHFMEKILTKRSLSQMIRMDLLNQHGYYVLSLFRQGIALSLAVNLVALPVTLFYFQKFPWMSLLYNLFFPLLVSGAMFLLLIGAILSLAIPFVADWIHSLNSGYTQWILNFTFNMPTTFDITLRVAPLPSWILISYLSILFAVSIAIKQQMEHKKEQLQDLAFL